MGGELLIHSATVQWWGQPLSSLQLCSIEGFVVFIASYVAQGISRRPTTVIPMCNGHLLLDCRESVSNLTSSLPRFKAGNAIWYTSEALRLSVTHKAEH